MYQYVNITWLLLTGKYLCWSLFLILSIAKFLRARILKNICVQLLLKMCSWNWEKSKFTRSFNFTLKTGFFNINGSMCNWGDEDNFKPVYLFIYFFSRKDFKRKKSTKRKTSDFYPLRSLCAQKIVAFVVFCSLVFVLFVGFLFVSVFIRAGFFL